MPQCLFRTWITARQYRCGGETGTLASQIRFIFQAVNYLLRQVCTGSIIRQAYTRCLCVSTGIAVTGCDIPLARHSFATFKPASDGMLTGIQ